MKRVFLFLSIMILLGACWPAFGYCDEPAFSQEAEAVTKAFAAEFETALGDAIDELAKKSDYQKYLKENPALAKLQRISAISNVESEFIVRNEEALENVPLEEQSAVRKELRRIRKEIHRKYEEAGAASTDSKKDVQQKDENAGKEGFNYEKARDEYAKELEAAMADAVAELDEDKDYKEALKNNPAFATLKRLNAVGAVEADYVAKGNDIIARLDVAERIDAINELSELRRSLKEKYVDGEGDAKKATKTRKSSKSSTASDDKTKKKTNAQSPEWDAFEKGKLEYEKALDAALLEEIKRLEAEPEYQEKLKSRPAQAKMTRRERLAHVEPTSPTQDELLAKLPEEEQIRGYDELDAIRSTLQKKYVEYGSEAPEEEPDDSANVDPTKPIVLPEIKVSENKRFLVTEDGELFFWLADTAWELFHRTARDEAKLDLSKRKLQGFNVIQAVAVAELGGLDVPNREGFLPFVDPKTPTPAVKDGPDNDYWDYVDFVIDEANKLGLYVGLLPSWGSWWKEEGGVLTPENAGQYGEWLGKRYKDKKLVWILGGDRSVDTDRERKTVEALALGLRRGDEGRHLITFHPRGGSGSSEYFHDAEWLDFNFRQNGHNIEYDSYKGTVADYDRTPIKPVIDGEPVYEDHPISFDPDHRGHTLAADVRKAFYWDVFNGAAGHTYGHHSVWQFYDSKVKDREPVNRPLMSWQEAIRRPGAEQMGYAKRLMESRPGLTRIPDPTLICDDEYASAVPGVGTRRFVATRDLEGSYAFIYLPVGRAVTVNTSLLSAERLRVFWFDPVDGDSYFEDIVENTGKQTFTPPFEGELKDWVLVLDDPQKNYSDPGSYRHSVRTRTIVLPAGVRPPLLPPLPIIRRIR